MDTCVWLDTAKDYQKQPVLGVIEDLLRSGDLKILLPRTVLDEFARNKAKVIEESSRSLSSNFKRIKEAVQKFSDPNQREALLSGLNDIDHRLPTLGSAAAGSVERIEAILNATPVIEISDEIKLRAAQRAIDGLAPFHRQKNSVNDAIIIEVYADAVAQGAESGARFGLVTHNTKDFGAPTDNELPHPDIASLFARGRSAYFTNLVEALRYVEPDQFEDLLMDYSWVDEPRRLPEILEAMEELHGKIWYNRHCNLKWRIETGKVRLVDEMPKRRPKDPLRWPIEKGVWEMSQEVARRYEAKLGVENLGPWTDFEWGMLNGKLSALRWMLGDEWDFLDT